MLSFDEYDEFINKFDRFKRLPHDELALDLQTTGFFSSFANNLHFALKEFMDTLVAKRYAQGAFPEAPKVLPKGNAIKILLGFLETGQFDHYLWTLSDKPNSWLQALGIQYDRHSHPIAIPTDGIVYGAVGEPGAWRNANSKSNTRLRMVINAALDDKGIGGPPFVTLLVSNALGIHARPAAFVVQSALRFASEIRFRREGQTVSTKSMMGLLCLAAPGGSVVQVLYGEGTENELDAFLNEIGAVKAPFGSPWQWEASFREAYH